MKSRIELIIMRDDKNKDLSQTRVYNSKEVREAIKEAEEEVSLKNERERRIQEARKQAEYYENPTDPLESNIGQKTEHIQRQRDAYPEEDRARLYKTEPIPKVRPKEYQERDIDLRESNLDGRKSCFAFGCFLVFVVLFSIALALIFLLRGGILEVLRSIF